MLNNVEVLGYAGSANESSVLIVRGVKNGRLDQSETEIRAGGVRFVAWPRRAESVVMVSTFTPSPGQSGQY